MREFMSALKVSRTYGLKSMYRMTQIGLRAVLAEVRGVDATPHGVAARVATRRKSFSRRMRRDFRAALSSLEMRWIHQCFLSKAVNHKPAVMATD